jgi:hypothetical protein
MLRFIASMASERGLGIVCALFTVLGLVGGAPAETSRFASVLQALVIIGAPGNCFQGPYGCVASVAEGIQLLDSTSALQITADRASAARRGS